MNNLTNLLKITKKATEIAEETENFTFTVLKTDTCMVSLVSRLILLYDGLIDGLIPFGISIDQLAQNNYELLDTLKAIVVRILQYADKQSLRERETLESFNVRIDALIEELNSPLFLQHRKPSDGSYHDDESDDKLPEPCLVSSSLFVLWVLPASFGLCMIRLC